MFYLPVPKVLCGFTQIAVTLHGILIVDAGFVFDTVFMGGILDPDF